MNRTDIWKDGEYNYRASYGFVPNIREYKASEKSDIIILVVPGGGYCMCTPHEGEIVAKKFNEKGYDSYVLTYTTDITFSIPLRKQPLTDISRAVRLIKKNNPDKKVAICGFSAGGHVCTTLMTHHDEIVDPDPELNKISDKPDAVILGYPVTTAGEYTHIYSIWALVGQNVPAEDLDYYSAEKNIREDNPPCFIWTTADDDLVPSENSLILASALKEKNVDFTIHVFPHGRHGLSMPCKDFFEGRAGGEYTMEQLDLVKKAVFEDKLIDVSEQRTNELKEQFSGEPPKFPNIDETHLYKDIAMWPDLCEIWLKRMFG